MPKRVLLATVFKPFAVDDIYNRKELYLELCHNQLTKAQGVFSMRTAHDTCGLHAIANNLEAPVTVLEFPTLDRFRRELKKGWDVVGIGAIMPNLLKVKRMAEETRDLLPQAKIVVGGFCANVPNLEKILPVDYICVGEGISFMRDFLGLPPDFTFKNPDVFSKNREIFGVPLLGLQRNPQIVVGLGCSYGCDFCSVTHFFGRKHLRFYHRGRDLFAEMVRVQKKFNANLIVFIGDDNFLLDRERALELRQCVIESGQVFKTFIFASADLARDFGPEKLAEMGVDTIWIGRESKFSDYQKNQGIVMKDLVAELKRFGIKTILSSILLVDRHTRDNLQEDIDEHLSCRPAFSQFTHYGPSPGTPLWERLKKEGRLVLEIPPVDCHGYKQPWILHPEFSPKQAELAQEDAYRRDFLELGPSIMRYVEVEYEGWKNLQDSEKPHLRKRAETMAKQMWKYRAVLLATQYLAPGNQVREMAVELLKKIESDFGPAAAFEKAAARGLQLAGRFREFRTRHWGDALQPRTRLTQYPR